MPGIFGASGSESRVWHQLRQEFVSPWPTCESVEVPHGIIGGHAFSPASAIHTLPKGFFVGVDGEAALYGSALDYALNGSPQLYELSNHEFTLTPHCKGNLAVVDSSTGTWYVGCDWTGSFPIYYFWDGEAFLFSSRLRPLARAVSTEADSLGIIEFLRSADTMAGRSLFRGIRRLQPGQVISYDVTTRNLRVAEASRAWVAPSEARSESLDAIAERAWEALREGAGRCLPAKIPNAVMMSGGWDSRTLLAAAMATRGPQNLVCYTHGDLQSREIEIVEKVCRRISIRLEKRPLGDSLYDPEFLKLGFDRVENVVFPHWLQAGRELHELEVSNVTAGIYGEVLGGHYGPHMLVGGIAKITAVGKALMGWNSSRAKTPQELLCEANSLLSPQTFNKPWYLDRDFWNSVPGVEEAFNSDIKEDLRRLCERGVNTLDSLIEAFIAEHRGAQYINAQLQSCRAFLDVALPFGDREAFLLASRIPLTAKIQNAVNRKMLQRHLPELLQHPCAATLVPAAAPLLLQEASRFARYLWEEAHWRWHFARPESRSAPHFGWVNFEFLRSGRALQALAEDLRGVFWDRSAIQRVLADVRGGRWTHLHPLSDAMLKIYSVDLHLRGLSVA